MVDSADSAPKGGGRTAASGAMVTSLVPASYNTGDNRSGVVTNTPADWFGPGNPMNPIAPPEVTGRRFDSQPAYNLLQAPKRLEGLPFSQLRALSRNYDVLRIVIETRKDQMAGLSWKIQPRKLRGLKAAQKVDDARIPVITEFFQYPDRAHDWATWLRLIMEDLLVLDAPTIYRRRRRNGNLYGYKPLAGDTIKPVIDDWGDLPAPPAAAFQQIFRGMAAINYTTRQIVYRPRNPATDRVYGLSPVEQILATVNIALQRETWQVRYFTNGTIPDTLIGVPDDWTGDQIRKFQESFDAMLSGNSERRAGGAIFIPNASGNNVTQMRETELFGAAEEWLARIVCFAFGISPQGFVKMMNRATGETQKDIAAEEGLGPQKMWVKSLMDEFLRDDFNSPDLEFLWDEEEATDPETADKIMGAQTASGRMTLNEARKANGEEPYSIPEADRPMVLTANGYVPIAVDDRIQEAGDMQAAIAPPEPADDGKPGGGGADDKGKPPAKGKPGEKFTVRAFGKAVAGAPQDGMEQDRPLARRSEKAIVMDLSEAFSECADDVAAQVSRALRKAGVAKAAGDVDIDALVADLDLSSMDTAVDGVADALTDVAQDTSRTALAQVGADTVADLVDVVNTRAVAFARARAAELVGKRWVDGELVDNPNPKWAITDTTRTMLRQIIADGLEENIGNKAIADAIQHSAAFSKERAKTVAMTEIANINEQSKLIAWEAAKEAGVTVKKKWLTAGFDVCDKCMANQAQGFISLPNDFLSGDDAPPGHPGCRCVLISEVIK